MTESNVTKPMRKKGSVREIEKVSLKIDMTPMVDLGFLLIVFFIFTTEISKPAVTKLYMPHDGDSTNVPDSKSLTILLGADDRVFYYYGAEEKAVKNNSVFQTSYDEINGLGKIIRGKQLSLANSNVNRNELTVLIKPGKESSYKNLVSSLDEMLINGVTRYAIVDPGNVEQNLLRLQNSGINQPFITDFSPFVNSFYFQALQIFIVSC